MCINRIAYVLLAAIFLTPCAYPATTATVTTDDVYLTFDVDVFDPSVLPDTGTPEPGGLTWYEATRFIRLLCQRKNIVGMDFMELTPQKGHHASDFLVAKLIYKCLGYWAAKQRGGKKG